MKTYISLFSSAGVGCYGFQMEGFECIATNELIPRRLEIQRFNHKCKYDSGYICGDITKAEIKQQLMEEIEKWEKEEKLSDIDVLIATPPCQGMSVANQKKHDDEIIRNSLVMESIDLVNSIMPKFFLFENVPAFMKAACTDTDGSVISIADAIYKHLSKNYSYAYRIINFKNYGASSSRKRTLVIGVRNDYADDFSPYELFPTFQKEKTLREVIGALPSLNALGEISDTDIYHQFRAYPAHMREWIKDLKEGESAFDNTDDTKKPHKVVDGQIIIHQQKNGDKYKRQYWDKCGPCVHTRNDQLASQNTIHPSDDRVFSIRELMLMMGIPQEFAWVATPFNELNRMTIEDKKTLLKKEEIKIRQSLGEAVPTPIFQSIAQKISDALSCRKLNTAATKQMMDQYQLTTVDDICAFIQDNPENLSLSGLSRITELANSKRVDNAAYYTNKILITEALNLLPEFNGEISILEPSAGVGNFIPLLVSKYAEQTLNIDIVDIDEDSLRIAQILFEQYGIASLPHVHINYICDDFLTHDFAGKKYDLVIGNPPYSKADKSTIELYKTGKVNTATRNLWSFFLEKSLQLGKDVSLVLPKNLLNTPEFDSTRKLLEAMRINSIIDFGEKGFKGVLIETICINVSARKKPSKTIIESVPRHEREIRDQEYITDSRYPYWIIYRNEFFDNLSKKMTFDVFSVFRDRQITKDNTQNTESKDSIWVIKSRNIGIENVDIIHLPAYDSYIQDSIAEALSVYRYLHDTDVYLVPNMTYLPRMVKKPDNVLVNGSVAILILKTGVPALTQDQIEFYATEEYRRFYAIARNYQTRSLNIDSNSVFFFGVLKN